MRHLHFVVNPKAGHGKALAVWRELSSRLRPYAISKGIEIEITHSMDGNTPISDVFPVCRSNATEKILVAVGGDGTMHFAGQQAMRTGHPLAIVPCGTGNDYAHSMNLPRTENEIMDMLVTGASTAVDVIRINDTYAFNVAGYGLDAEVVKWIEEHSGFKNLGRIGYGLGMPGVLHKHKPFTIRLSGLDEGSVTINCVHLVAIANGSQFGGGMKIAPTASATDGKLNVVVVSGLSKLELIRLFPKIYRGTHLGLSQVRQFTTSGFELQFADNIPLTQHDGELYPCANTLVVETSPSLHLVLPHSQQSSA